MPNCLVHARSGSAKDANHLRVTTRCGERQRRATHTARARKPVGWRATREEELCDGDVSVAGGDAQLLQHGLAFQPGTPPFLDAPGSYHPCLWPRIPRRKLCLCGGGRRETFHRSGGGSLLGGVGPITEEPPARPDAADQSLDPERGPRGLPQLQLFGHLAAAVDEAVQLLDFRRALGEPPPQHGQSLEARAEARRSASQFLLRAVRGLAQLRPARGVGEVCGLEEVLDGLAQRLEPKHCLVSEGCVGTRRPVVGPQPGESGLTFVNETIGEEHGIYDRLLRDGAGGIAGARRHC